MDRYRTLIARGFLIILLAFSGCSLGLGDTSLEVTIVNNTSQQLLFLDVGGVVKVDEFTLGPGEKHVVTADRLGYTTFVVLYDGDSYRGDSGNTDDYSWYKLIFADNSGSLTRRVAVPGSRGSPVKVDRNQ